MKLGFSAPIETSLAVNKLSTMLFGKQCLTQTLYMKYTNSNFANFVNAALLRNIPNPPSITTCSAKICVLELACICT
jgi:hypothetical protein